MENGKNLTDREKTLLLTLIKYYIDLNEPVGSRTLSKKLELALSPASIRNIMADLEEKGFLTHPHTSAGRIPTEKGYRFFVNEVMKNLVCKMETFNKEEYIESVLTQIKERAVMLSKISSILSDLSHYVGIVLAPKFSQLTLKHIDFVNMGGASCLAIFVSQSGLVFNRMIDIGEIIPQEELDKMSRYINHQFVGLSLIQMEQKIFKLMSEEKIVYDHFVRKSIQLSKKVIDQKESNDIFDIYVDGRLNILDQPEFSTLQKMRSFFEAFEKKENLIRIMDQFKESEGVQVLIGSETMYPEMRDCSLVMSTYQIRPKVQGIIGVIGPTRMRYWDVIAMIDQIAMILTRIFKQNF